ncbi:NAD-binding protein [Nostoc sp. ChiQUE01b]|uniref:NAD-binding protein n=1 Tax=Nostoc sp. ChiQUE01b TaxID=3075376 RepID=UPI002AD303FA|nr:NAD-binding protein [Nostoc sp. ChiQUE01b]MDZ8263598.1 NAD-binding protein [Nostoc sp. ChiQUE01b]
MQELNQPLVGIHPTILDQETLPDIPLIVGNATEALTKANLSHAKSIILVGDDNMENLEIGLMAHAMNPATTLIIRSQDRQFSDNVTPLFPYAQVLSVARLCRQKSLLVLLLLKNLIDGISETPSSYASKSYAAV